MQAPDCRNKILVVDDEDELVGAVRLRLRCAGFVVLSAGDGRAAVDLAETEQPDLIVMDIGLPGENGHQVAQRLKSNPKTDNIPIVFFTARATAEEVDRSWKSGAAAFLPKICGSGRIAGSGALLKTVSDILDLWPGGDAHLN